MTRSPRGALVVTGSPFSPVSPCLPPSAAESPTQAAVSPYPNSCMRRRESCGTQRSVGGVCRTDWSFIAGY
jgi:hypothetical protein